VSVAHACLAQTFFCLTVAIAVATSRGFREQAPAALSKAFRKTPVALLAGAAAAAVFLQLVIGAVMRHTKAGLSIPDFPLALGRLVPPLSSFPVAIHYVHRVWALVVAGLVAASTVAAFRSGRRGLKAAGVWLSVLVVVQIALGAATVLSGRDVLVTTAHVATGALLLGSSLALSLSALAVERRRNNVVPIRPALARRVAGWK
jgi:cytochrome c oxidase assembly protein subunit 15